MAKEATHLEIECRGDNITACGINLATWNLRRPKLTSTDFSKMTCKSCSAATTY